MRREMNWPITATWFAALLAGSAWAGPDWVEIGDAGNRIETAQPPRGMVGNLNTITGVLRGEGLVGSDFEDLYFIRIADPEKFSCTITAFDFNAQLFLFNVTLPMGGYGLLANDDEHANSVRPRLTNRSNDGTNVVVDLPGDYVIAVTGFNNDPLSSSGAIFNQVTTTEISGPDGPGGFNRLIGWTGGGETGEYRVTLTGVEFPSFPAPGTALVFGAGLVATARRRR